MGLIYEPLFLYDPVHGHYIPWLATSGGWTGSTYVLQVREGVRWSDGERLSGADVAYSIDLALTNRAVPYSNIAVCSTTTGCLKGAVAKGGTVTVAFSSPPPYAAWQQYLWTAPVVPALIWSKLSPFAQAEGANLHPVGTGPMLLDYHDSTEVAYEVNPRWWGTSQLGLHFRFRYLVDQVTGSTTVELQQLLLHEVDWSNNFQPGIANVVGDNIRGYNIVSYYPGAPYVLPAGTAWLEPNTAKAPMDSAAFRKALAYALRPKAIVSSVDAAAVAPANPTGLPLKFSSYIDKSIVKEYGFSYDPRGAERYLKESGYKGEPLTLEVPAGQGDVAAGASVVARELSAVGIKVTVVQPSYAAWEQDIANGSYDLTIAGQDNLYATPWEYFDRVFQVPMGTEELSGLNMERYSDAAAWALVQQAATVPPVDTSRLQRTYGQLEKDFLRALPEIPLWYGGAWAEGNKTYWTDFPSSSNHADQYTPVLWPGWLGSTTTVLALAELKPA
jgi:peptide/nickel transport system substrate-binding protein